jgi:hypothetical protein
LNIESNFYFQYEIVLIQKINSKKIHFKRIEIFNYFEDNLFENIGNFNEFILKKSQNYLFNLNFISCLNLEYNSNCLFFDFLKKFQS